MTPQPSPAPSIEDRQAAIDRTARVEQLVKNSGVPEKYWRIRLGEASRIPPDCRERYLDACATLRKLLIEPAIVAVVGGRGPGKTHCAWALVLEFCRQARSARYIEVDDYFEDIKATFSPQARRKTSDIESQFLRYRFLAIDEFFEKNRQFTPWEDRTITRLIRKRHDETGLPTVIISNQTEEAFLETIGTSIKDRMRAGGGVLVMDWDSLRGRLLPAGGR